MRLFEPAVKEEDDVMFRVVDQSEGTDAARLQTEVAHHPFRRGERQFARGVLPACHQCLFQPVLEVVDGEVVVAVKTDEVVLVAFVVAHKDVLAVNAAVVAPPAFGFLDGLAFGVVVAFVGDAVPVKVM